MQLENPRLCPAVSIRPDDKYSLKPATLLLRLHVEGIRTGTTATDDADV